MYDPASGTWTRTGSFVSTARAQHTATLLPGGSVLLAGGTNPAGGYALGGGELYDPASGTWRVDMPKMQAAVDALAAKILNLQGDGDYAGSLAFLPKDAAPDATLQADLSRLAAASIPTDIVWRQ